MPEVEILPACQHFGIGVTSYSPIARGVLTGKYLPGQQLDPNSRGGRADKRMTETELREESFVIAQTLMKHCHDRSAGKVSLAHFATAWVLANPAISAVIAGPRTLQQWQDYLPAIDYVVTSKDEKLVDSLVHPGHPSTPGYTDPAYPLNGRDIK
jgi:aryl-alcohol dehydrogenase-like predicted oxidoreductase